MVILFAKYCPVTNEPSFSQSGILIKAIPCSWVLQAYVSEALQILKELGERFTSSINVNKLKKKREKIPLHRKQLNYKSLPANPFQ